jgi:hypothetical protein
MSTLRAHSREFSWDFISSLVLFETICCEIGGFIKIWQLIFDLGTVIGCILFVNIASLVAFLNDFMMSLNLLLWYHSNG